MNLGWVEALQGRRQPSLFSCSLSSDLSVTFKRVITVRATLTGHFDDVIVMLLVCLNKMSNKRQLKLTAFTNKVRKAADYSFGGFNVFKTLIDGNCMFAALAHQLNMDTQPDTDSTVTAQEVRQSLVAYLRDNPTLCDVDSLPEGNIQWLNSAGSQIRHLKVLTRHI